MSLTWHLDHSKQSPIGQFLRQRFSQTRIITKETNAKLKASTTLLPAVHLWPYDKIGMAMDYRIRYSFDITPKERLAAWLGVGFLAFKLLESDDDVVVTWDELPQGISIPIRLDGGPIFGDLAQGPYRWEMIETFFSRLDDILKVIQPVRRRLTLEEERIMARYCFVLALFEEVYRDGIDGRAKYGPLFVPVPKQSVDELLATVEDAWVDDLCQLSVRFYDTCHHLLSHPFILNPTFAGSGDVGGADADLIVDGCLIEIKTSRQAKIHTDWLRQLVGYVLLDYNDKHLINSVGIYMARQGLLFTWPIADFLRLLTQNDAVSLPQLRQEFSDLCKNRRAKNANSKEIE